LSDKLIAAEAAQKEKSARYPGSYLINTNIMGLTRDSKWKVCEIMEVRDPWMDSDDEEETANDQLNGHGEA
jgi:hypothetical protein